MPGVEVQAGGGNPCQKPLSEGLWVPAQRGSPYLFLFQRVLGVPLFLLHPWPHPHVTGEYWLVFWRNDFTACLWSPCKRPACQNTLGVSEPLPQRFSPMGQVAPLTVAAQSRWVQMAKETLVQPTAVGPELELITPS